MPTRALLLRAADRATPRTLWRDRDLIGPLLGLLMAAVVLRDLGRRLAR